MAQVGRMIDDVPSRSELIQYERRFVELYEQVSDKLDETRKHFSTYNALDQKRTYIQKEVSLRQCYNLILLVSYSVLHRNRW